MTIIIHHDKSQTPVPVNDRSFNYGDGFFTTILSKNNQLQLLELHINRLKRAASRLSFVGVDWSQLEQSLQATATTHPSVIKVLVSRGAGGRGYNPGKLDPFIYITVADYPQIYDSWHTKGICLGVSPVQLGLNPLLAGIKHCNRLEQVMIKKAAEKQPVDDVVVCDLNGSVVECSASNIFWLPEGGSPQQWYTPLNESAGVDGVMKQFIIENLAGFGQTKQVKQPFGALIDAKSLFVCNSLMGMVPVNCLVVDSVRHCYDTTEAITLGKQLRQLLDG